MEKFLKELEQIINMDSGTSDVDGCRQVASFFYRRLGEAGLCVSTIPYGPDRRPMVVAVSPGTVISSDAIPDVITPGAASDAEKRYDFLLVGHMDTVFPKGTAARRPFHLDMEEGRAYGPGTVDMKAGALLMVYIAEYLTKHAPEISLCLALNSDEETGSLDSAPLLAALGRQARRAFVFEGGRKNGQFVHQRKGCTKYEIQVHGVASHAGTAPKQGASAIVEAAHLILKLDKLKQYERGTSVNVGLIEGGTALNVVADSCTLKVEVRYTEEKEQKRIEKALSRLQTAPYVSGTSISIHRLSSTPPLNLTAETAELMRQMEAYGRISGQAAGADSYRREELPPVAFVSAGGLSDANRLAICEIPIIDGCGPGGGFPHSEKEFLSLETVLQRFRFMTGVMEYICSKSAT